MKQQRLRELPAVDEILEYEELAGAAPRAVLVNAIRQALDELRISILKTEDKDVKGIETTREIIVSLIKKQIDTMMTPRLRRVINATGIVVHTNLGRSILAQSALDALAEVSRGYSNLEYNLEAGSRGSRHDHIKDILVRLTGAEDAMVVNNNAAAVLLSLSAVAQGSDVIVSRGELVEIGGSFRIPDVMRQSGADLVEVGSTNKTHLDDYSRVIGENTALLLKVHTSNFKIVGFTSEVPIEELVALGRQFNIPVMHDLGSGMLVELESLGFIDEPTVEESVRAGVDLITFSGDKLLGGPQAGIIIGKKAPVSMCRSHPLARAFRVDKFTLAALEATLRIYLDPPAAISEIPTLRMISANSDSLAPKASKLAERLTKEAGEGYDVMEIAEVSRAGGGALPLVEIPTAAVSVMPRAMEINALERRLRENKPPIIARIKEDRLILDVRTIDDDEIDEIVEAFRQIAAIK